MAHQMPEESDNACMNDIDNIEPQNINPLSTDTRANGAGIALDLEKQIKCLTEEKLEGAVL